MDPEAVKQTVTEAYKDIRKTLLISGVDGIVYLDSLIHKSESRFAILHDLLVLSKEQLNMKGYLVNRRSSHEYEHIANLSRFAGQVNMQEHHDATKYGVNPISRLRKPVGTRGNMLFLPRRRLR